MSTAVTPLSGLARSTDPSTSHEAAQSINVTEREQLVIDTIRAIGPATQEEVADYTNVERPAISPRFKPLVNKGIIQIVGERKNRSGRKAKVFGLVSTVTSQTTTPVSQ